MGTSPVVIIMPPWFLHSSGLISFFSWPRRRQTEFRGLNMEEFSVCLDCGTVLSDPAEVRDVVIIMPPCLLHSSGLIFSSR